jgi:hypothetical protein
MALGLIAVGVSRVGMIVVDQAQARTAADAAALAGELGGRLAALDAARRNGAALDRYDDRGGAVSVRVHRGRAIAVASAARHRPSVGTADPYTDPRAR